MDFREKAFLTGLRQGFQKEAKAKSFKTEKKSLFNRPLGLLAALKAKVRRK